MKYTPVEWRTLKWQIIEIIDNAVNYKTNLQSQYKVGRSIQKDRISKYTGEKLVK